MIKIDFAHVKQIAQGTPIVMSHLQRESVSDFVTFCDRGCERYCDVMKRCVISIVMSRRRGPGKILWCHKVVQSLSTPIFWNVYLKL